MHLLNLEKINRFKKLSTRFKTVLRVFRHEIFCNIITFLDIITISYIIFDLIALFNIPDKIAWQLFCFTVFSAWRDLLPSFENPGPSYFFIIFILINIFKDIYIFAKEKNKSDKKDIYIFLFVTLVLYIIISFIIYLVDKYKTVHEVFGYYPLLVWIAFYFIVYRFVKKNYIKLSKKMFTLAFVLIPSFLIIMILIIIPSVLEVKYQHLLKKFTYNINIIDLDKFYHSNANENAFLFFKDKQNFTKLKNKNLTETGLFKDITIDGSKENTKIAEMFLDSLSHYIIFQDVFIGSLGDKEIIEGDIDFAKIPYYETISWVVSTGLRSAQADIYQNDLSLAKDKILKVWHLIKIVRNSTSNSIYASLCLSNKIIQFMYKGLRENWLLKEPIYNLSILIFNDIEQIPFVLPTKNEIKDNRILRTASLNLENYFYLRFVSKLNSDVFHRFIMVQPFVLPIYKYSIKVLQLYFPHKFESKNDYLYYFINDSIGERIKGYIKYTNDRLLATGILFGVPDFSDLIMAEIDLIAKSRVLCEMLEIEKQYHGKNNYPDEYKPNILDPYSLKPLKYKKTKKFYIVYSIGKNKKDDGGQIDGKNALDIGFKKSLTQKNYRRK